MLLWNDLHPYNAVHVVRIPGGLDLERLKAIIRTTLAHHGLTRVTLDQRSGTYQYDGAASPGEIKILTTDGDSASVLTQEIEQQLNTPFKTEAPFSPFRFLVIPEPDGFSLGLVYFHAIADAECILLLLKEMVEVYRNQADLEPANRVDCYPIHQGNFFGPHPGWLFRKLLALPSLFSHLRHTSRPYYRDIGNFHNQCTLFTLQPPVLRCLAQAAKSLGVTLNDVFLALLLKAISLITPDRTHEPRRRVISLGCIVNLRKDLGLADRRIFGLFLGSFLVHHQAPAGVPLADLARDIGQQTLHLKRHRLYLGTPLELVLARFLLSLFRGPRRRKFFQNNYPLWGGLTNMDLNSYWRQPANLPPPIDYVRAVSTGPVTPLVISITTVGQSANIGLSYRSTVFSAHDIACIKSCFLNPQELLTGYL